jgi:hypothetical protein
MVRAVKRELTALEDSAYANHESALFIGKQFDLEISFAAHADAGGKAGVHYDVLTLEGQRNVSADRVQKLTLHYEFAPPTRGSTPPDSRRPDSMPTHVIPMGTQPLTTRKDP